MIERRYGFDETVIRFDGVFREVGYVPLIKGVLWLAHGIRRIPRASRTLGPRLAG